MRKKLVTLGFPVAVVLTYKWYPQQFDNIFKAVVMFAVVFSTKLPIGPVLNSANAVATEAQAAATSTTSSLAIQGDKAILPMPCS